jgi:hypothetical protein
MQEHRDVSTTMLKVNILTTDVMIDKVIEPMTVQATIAQTTTIDKNVLTVNTEEVITEVEAEEVIITTVSIDRHVNHDHKNLYSYQN